MRNLTVIKVLVVTAALAIFGCSKPAGTDAAAGSGADHGTGAAAAGTGSGAEAGTGTGAAAEAGTGTGAAAGTGTGAAAPAAGSGAAAVVNNFAGPVTAETLNGTWNIDFARSIQQAQMSDEERAMAMALMGSMQMSITFNADGTMAMNATMMGETKTEGGSFRVTGTTPNSITIETTTPGEGSGEPPKVETATISFTSFTEASIAPNGEDPLFMTKAP